MKSFTTLNDEGLLVEGIEYDIGLNDGTTFNRISFKGTKFLNGKPMLCFETTNKSQLSINPSYHSFTLECDGQFPIPEDFQPNNKGDDLNG